MTRTTPELALLSPSFRATPAAGCLAYVGFSAYQVHKQDGYSMEWGFEPRAQRLRSRDLTPRPPRHLLWRKEKKRKKKLHVKVVF
ncbi:hypothetical protein AVEN_248031-1 [Araneus ventricosus]|uniref:Uncharacterized protein n=1 Tax=Araneus ventricosus TaxID=182803 RepID=A0A4Y2JWT1_ARAVE|nr:hypothetical protein AVEN_248031-1 [Araneus ventricosus]